MTKTSETNPKVTCEHLNRPAYVYVRQSSLYQVENHLESKRRQYDFVQSAVSFGWAKEHVNIIDEDQGKSGAVANARSGFSRLIHIVGRSAAGIVMSLEASRLARNSPDWHTLIYMCRYTNTLIADETGVFDPSSSTDRMVLGIRGQMSEMELDMSIHRMVEGRMNKARRGEYLIFPPSGYELDELKQVILSPDETVVSAIQTLFAKFDELQSVKRVFDWWRDEHLKFPVRRVGLRTHPVVWIEPAYKLFLYMLHHPFYAGAYVFGRSKTVRELDPTDPRKLCTRQVSVPRDEWMVLIKDHHVGYISFAQYEKNQKRIVGNCQMKVYDRHDGQRGPAREGEALLQGLTRCGHCGRSMLVSYGGARPSGKENRVLQYRCFGSRRLQPEGRECQVIGGKRINEAVVKLFLEVSGQASEEVAQLSSGDLFRLDEETERLIALQIEKAEYEAKRAERQFNAVEPENRLVARTLEARWNVCLAEVERLRHQAQEKAHVREPLSIKEQECIRRLAFDLERVWHAPKTTNADRKHLLRAAIEEVQLTSEEECYRIKILWKGGVVSERSVKRFRVGINCQATAEDTIEMIRKLASELDDAQIARVLNRQGRKTGKGNPFTAHRVAMHRNRNEIKNSPKLKVRDAKEGPFTADEAAAELGVCSSTIHRWLRDGILPGQQIAVGAPWKIVLTEELRQKLSGGDAPIDWMNLGQAAQHLGVSRQMAAYLVKQGKLKAMRTIVGGRDCWKIDVSSMSSDRQIKLFDKKNNEICKEV